MYETFIKVECRKNGKLVYKDYFMFAQRPEKYRKNRRGRSKINVLLLGVDGVSRLNFLRQMPKTSTLLEDLGAFDMLGYNKVGYETFHNLIPILTGLFDNELRKTCWQTQKTFFDNCTFIWNYFKNKSYITGYGEDSINIGLFEYLKAGFKKPPTDFYMNNFMRLAEDDIGHEKWLNTQLCLGIRLTNEVFIESVRSFVFNLKNLRSFGLFWGNSLSHDFLNLPKLTDETHFNFFTDMKNYGILENTVVIFLSDHGIRWGSIRNTYQGYLEERLPFLYILIPSQFRSRFPIAVNNLRQNQYRLLTPFDLHETLYDLLDLGRLKDNAVERRSLLNPIRGISLFLPISGERTCKNAAIPDTWCTCHQRQVELSNTTKVVTAAERLINYLNHLIRNYTKCSKLKLHKIIKGLSDKVPLAQNEKEMFEQKLRIDYTVTIETAPGLGLFEAIVRYDPEKNYKVLPPVSRLNIYGNQSSCVSDILVKRYCYCLNKTVNVTD